MAVESNVRWFHSEMPGAPVLASNAYGSFIGVLKACLIDGFGTQGVDGITVSGGVATVSISAGNGFPEHTVVQVSGANQPLLNGVWRVKSPTANSFTFDCPGVPNGAAGGAISVGVAKAVDWSMQFEDAVTKKAVFRSVAFGATGFYLQVQDSSQYRSFAAYESMTAIDTGTDLFSSPTNSVISFGALNSTPLSWILVADDRAVHFVGDFNGFTGRGCPLHFGDFDKILSSDAYNYLITGVSSSASSPTNYLGVNFHGTLSSSRIARSFDGLTKSIAPLFTNPLSGSMTNGMTIRSDEPPGLATYGGNMPLLGRVTIAGTTGQKMIRGFIPGVVTAGAFVDLEATNNRMVFSDSRGGVYLVANTGTNNSSVKSLIVYDLIGPWR